MAEVKMDLAELDKMRQEIKEKTEKVKDLENSLVEMKADKRVIVRRRPPTKNDFTYSLDMNRVSYMQRNNRQVSEILKECIEIYPITNLQNDSSQFIHFEDAKVELRKELEEEYKTELADLRHTKKVLDERIAERDRDNMEYQKKLLKEHKVKEDALLEEIKEWDKKYKELETGKKELSKIEELQKLLEDLTVCYNKEKAKSWWTKLINK